MLLAMLQKQATDKASHLGPVYITLLKDASLRPARTGWLGNVQACNCFTLAIANVKQEAKCVKTWNTQGKECFLSCMYLTAERLHKYHLSLYFLLDISNMKGE